MSEVDFAALLELQDLDKRIDQETHRRANLPTRAELAELLARVAQQEAERATLVAARDEVAARQAVAESELQALETRAAQVSARLYGGSVTASRELQAMAADVDSMKKRASELEDRALALMEEREPLDAQVAKLDDELAALERRRQEVAGRLATAESEVDAVLAGLSSQRPGALAGLPAQTLATYERLRGRLGGVAVARLTGGRCDGCHLSLPAMDLDRIRHQSAASLELCEQCGRILVVAPGG
jgi:hypothetical protein